MSDEQQPLYADGWRANEPSAQQPGETDDEYHARQMAQLRATLAEHEPEVR